MKKDIVWLPSWYPNKTGPFDGDFIRRQAFAASRFNNIFVIFVIKDISLPAGSREVVEEYSEGNLHETIVYLPAPRMRWTPLHRLAAFLHYLRTSRRLVREHINRHGRPALLHVHVVLRAGFTALWAGKKFSVPFLVTEHWTGYDPASVENIYGKNFFLRHITYRVIRQAARILPVSDHLGRLIQLRFGNTPFTVVPNAVDTSCFKPERVAHHAFRFIHVSTMKFQKNCEGIVRCFAALAATDPNAELVMAGPAPEALQQLGRELGVAGKIIWTGEIPYGEVAEQMQQADSLVMFSRYENLPCVILEALCTGLPVISTRVGGIEEVIKDDNGILVPEGDEQRLLDAMHRMRREHHVFNREMISTAAREKFNYDMIGGRIDALYENELFNSSASQQAEYTLP